MSRAKAPPSSLSYSRSWPMPLSWPDTSIHDVAVALRRAMGDEALERALEGLPAEARAFWSV